ncbi:MAG: DNA methyltransferase [Myxococcales bacterium]|nr:DNA methyltransferase [Myxococcales bacterium]
MEIHSSLGSDIPEFNYETEGIRYTGSKREIIPRILSMVHTHCSDVETVLDACAGTTRVSQAFRKNGYTVTANDLASYTKVFAQCYLLNNKPVEYYQKWIDTLNSLEGKTGWFTNHYGGEVTTHSNGNAVQADGQKRPWQTHNTQKLDAVLEMIPKLTHDPIEQAVLLTSTILAMDKVDNTMGHQVAYLKQWPKRSYDSIKLHAPQLFASKKQCFTTQSSIFDINKYYDLVYIDPPYGTNNQKTKTTRVRYRSYYHLWTTVCQNDQPNLHGAALRRYDASSDSLPNGISVFESTDHAKVYKATKDLMKRLNCKYILFSYASKAKLSEQDLREIFQEYTILEFAAFAHKENAMKHATTNAEWLGDQSKNQEFLILVKKST